MSRDPGFWIQLGLLYVTLCQRVFGVVPPPTNLSVVCHNFKNVLYWNYGSAVQQPMFTVNLIPYESDSQTLKTSETLLDISSYSSDTTDHYVVLVTADVGQENSESLSVKFTYSTDYYDGKTHKCTLDFPPVDASVHKDVIEVVFKHPSAFYTQASLEEEFVYTITLNQEKFSHSCFEDEDELENLCEAKVHVNQSLAGQCVELKFEGKIASIPVHTYRNVCVPQLEPASAKTELIAAFLCGGFALLFIVSVILWFIYKNFSKIPKVPTILRNIVTRPSSTPYSQPESPHVSSMTSATHNPVLVYNNESLLDFVHDEVSRTTDTLVNTEVEEPAPSEEEYDSSGGFGKSSDYDSPKCLLEMSPGDFSEGYGPRPPIL
ncbi:interferon gamma receptor 1-like [Danio aesculapii]|uniref:interferon gamma receptor 1-like n=1 Tax=Danio aesculapii TaxID=1142201 RepID=UPI0024C0919F|nr:interferon gamma receptor 1-like [Danio aesculapii]